MNPLFISLIEASRRSYREQGGIKLQDLREKLGLKKSTRAKASSSKKKSAAQRRK